MDHFDPVGFLNTALSREVDPLSRLEALTILRRNLERVEADLVGVARSNRSGSWAGIARALDRRKQSVWAKHHEQHP